MTGKAYVELNGNLTNKYVVLGGKRVYVPQSAGAELTKSEARRMSATESKNADVQTDSE